MKTYRPTDSTELAALIGAAETLAAANKKAAEASKAVEAAKGLFVRWLREQRECEIETLVIGDMIEIEGVVLIEIGSMNKFDERGFQLAEPELHATWKKEFPVKKFRVLK